MIKIVKPTLDNIIDIQRVLKPYVEEGIILNRDEDEIAMNIRSYQLVFDDKQPIAVGALHIYSPFLGEIRSLAVNEKYQGQGIGKKLVNSLLEEAKSLKLKEVLVLTYKKEFFEKLGFNEIQKEEIPEKKIWADCIKCKFFPNCNEIALITYL
ncbi:N-acetyltransferase [Caminibacter pacificus]|uniref:N-acetyltransferase n=1 Tax=Caminibacter pacificus TaxID=1424653 RepID=A0AAJ4UYL1_9BACT|nr:N-acetyltransferase [Caminibacter pacificus]QCI28240.1 N-acetyltransferase [Caminibacter pacificus]ROR41046.1 amino-acid N-acetyltransferase [Caminibacter pacificus]